MKTYGPNKATEFTRKQIGVIFAKAKRGELKVEKFIMADFYNLSEYYGYDDNGSIEESEGKILEILDNIFDGDIENAQLLINEYTEDTFSRLSVKRQKLADRNFVK